MSQRFINQNEQDGREIEALAAGLKALSTWHTTHTLQMCREACGGAGYMTENRFAELKADTDIFTTFEGDNTVLLQLVAKGRLTAFKKEFRNMNMWGLLKFASHQASHYLIDFNPISVRNTNTNHLQDSNFHLHLLQAREEDLVMSVANRLKKRIDNGQDAYEAFIECQNHLIVMAKAYIERIVLQQFILKVEQCEDEALKTVLKTVCDVYALHTIHENKGWFLEQGYLEGVKTKAIRKQLETLCLQLRFEAEALVEAFGIPDNILAAPIALQK